MALFFVEHTNVMKLFGSREAATYPSPDEIALSDSWSVINAELGPDRLVGALRDDVSQLAGHPAYRHQAGIALVLEQPRVDGMPGPEESARIYRLEDNIQAELEKGNQSLLVAKWFIRGCRELVFYTLDVKAMTGRLDDLAARGTTNQIQLTTNKDPDWKILQTFAKAA
jgi:hypothetical protein